LNQPSSWFGFQVVFYPFRPGPRPYKRAIALFDLLEIKERAVGVGDSSQGWKHGQSDISRRVGVRDGAVRGPEIDADSYIVHLNAVGLEMDQLGPAGVEES